MSRLLALALALNLIAPIAAIALNAETGLTAIKPAPSPKPGSGRR
jgi:hypothetical protein